MKEFFKQQRRMNMLYDAVCFVGFAFILFLVICRIILIAVN